MTVLQIVFLLTFLALGVITVRLWLLRRAYPFPGGDWWVSGGAGLALTPLLAACSPYLGEWMRTIAAHLSFIGGFCAIWIGTRRFLGCGESRLALPAVLAFLAALGGVFYWFWVVDPQFQIRLTVNCVVLVLLSLGISQALFADRTRAGMVTASGVLFMIFALINCFRTINIILFPVPGSLFLSDGVTRSLTLAMIPVLVAALVTLEYLARPHADPSSVESE